MSAVVPLFPDLDPPKPNTKIAATRFEEAWKIWPVKAGKLIAKAKYEAVIKGCSSRTLEKDSGMFINLELKATEDEVIDGIKKYLASQVDKNTYRLKDEGKYIPHLATFLNRGRWADFQ